MRSSISHIAICSLFALVGSTYAAEPELHARIDQAIVAKAGGPLAERSSDAEFARRIYLDLGGRIPSRDELQSFLADTAANKREKRIDQLLASEDHVRRLSQALHVMLMERLGDHEEWQKFLRESVKTNKPWDQLVREIVNPDASNEQTRGAALWFTKRLENYGQNPVDIPGLVRDVGRHFLGVDVQCAQCHDHLFVDEYKQEHYHGLLAFVGSTGIRGDVKFPAVVVKPVEKKAEFISVFVKEPKSVGPKLPDGEEVTIPTLADTEKFEQPPDPAKNLPGIPKFHTLKILAEQLPRSENARFTRNIANRLWWVMLGRGQVWPLDMNHSGNPPTHPEILEAISDDLKAHAFDIRRIIREIALSETYQRSGITSDEAILSAPQSLYRLALEKPLSAEQMLASLRQALGTPQPLAINSDDKTWKDWQAKFEKALANPPREPEVEHSPTVKAALFIMNEATVQAWLKPEGENLVARLMAENDNSKVASELYLATLSRFPSEEETREVAEFVDARKDRKLTAIQSLVWSRIASNEFCSNH